MRASRSVLLSLLSLLFVLPACDAPAPERSGSPDCEGAVIGEGNDPVDLAALACVERVDAPVLRDPIPSENYEAASDGHVFRDEEGTLRMIYAGEGGGGRIGIKLATGADWDDWSVTDTLLGPSTANVAPNKETPFYRLADDGTHQIFFIGYDEEEAYEAEIYLAEAPALTGPWTIHPDPVVPRGPQGGRDVYLITSPSVMQHEGQLYMAYIGWNDAPDSVSEVWVMGARSNDDGRTWSDIREVDTPIGMEGQVTKGPDGRFYAAWTGPVDDTEGIGLGVADHPFGPWTTLDSPVLVKAGAPWEVDESIAPQLTFDTDTRTAHLYYAGADYSVGWWMMLASARY